MRPVAVQKKSSVLSTIFPWLESGFVFKAGVLRSFGLGIYTMGGLWRFLRRRTIYMNDLWSGSWRSNCYRQRVFQIQSLTFDLRQHHLVEYHKSTIFRLKNIFCRAWPTTYALSIQIQCWLTCSRMMATSVPASCPLRHHRYPVG